MLIGVEEKNEIARNAIICVEHFAKEAEQHMKAE